MKKYKLINPLSLLGFFGVYILVEVKNNIRYPIKCLKTIVKAINDGRNMHKVRNPKVPKF